MLKPQIAFLLQSFYIGGYENFLYRLSNELKNDFDFHFIATENTQLNQALFGIGKPIYLDDSGNITKYISENKIDIVQFGNKLEYKEIAQKAGVPIIIERTAGPRSCGLDKSGVTHVVSSSKGTVPLTRKNYTGPLTVIYNGICLSDFENIEPNRCGFKPNDFVIVYAARYGRGQAFDTLISSVIAARKSIDVKLILVGGHPNIPGAENITKEIKKWVAPLGKSCVLTGFVLDPRSIQAAASVYVCPARHKGISNSIIEACALGKPVISSNVGQSNEIVFDGINGYLVPVNDTKTLCEKIIRLHKYPELRTSFGSAGKSVVRREFNIECQAQKYKTLYLDLLGDVK